MSGKITITVAENISECVFRPSDWSILNIPESYEQAKRLEENLFNMPCLRHSALLLCRHKRKFRLKALKSLTVFDNKNWGFIDSVTIGYDKPSNCSNNYFLPMSEIGFLLYKGQSPLIKGTSWFEPEYKNATTKWDVRPQPKEMDFFKNTYYHKFSWEIQLLMYSMVSVREHSRFTYGLPISSSEIRSLQMFCNEHNMDCELIVESDEKRDKIQKVLETINI